MLLAVTAAWITSDHGKPRPAANMATSYANSWWKRCRSSQNSGHEKWPLSLSTPASLCKKAMSVVVLLHLFEDHVWVAHTLLLAAYLEPRYLRYFSLCEWRHPRSATRVLLSRLPLDTDADVVTSQTLWRQPHVATYRVRWNVLISCLLHVLFSRVCLYGNCAKKQ